jgi:hypothetical protein
MLRKSDWTIRPIEHEQASSFIVQHHYAGGGSNTAVFTHGLFSTLAGLSVTDQYRCHGVAWWLPPTRACAEATIAEKSERHPDGVTGVTWQGVLSLSRLALSPDVPANGATFLLMRSVRLVRQDNRFHCLVTYADTWQGHTGHIYRAAGWEYLGLTASEEVWVDSRGRMVARKAGPKTRTRAEMIKLGYRSEGKHSKHKFRLVLPVRPRRSEKTLFDVLEYHRGQA